MNDSSKHLRDLTASAASANATVHDSPEEWLSAGAAAIWRRRLRGYRAFPLHPGDVEGAGESLVSTDSATIGSPGAIARDFAEFQQAGLAALSRLAQTAGPDRPPTSARSGAPWRESPVSPQGLATYTAPARHGPATASITAAPDRPVRPTPPVLAPSGALDAHRKADRQQTGVRSGRRSTHLTWLYLIVILTIQAVLSLRLVWSNTAFLDEATYLFGGHVEIMHWLRGTPIPPFATYFSGAPVIYPPLAALAASIGGLAAARLLSLTFMLGATGLLWSTTSKLFGRFAAFFAAALFAVVGPTETLGAFATYDAMALFLLAASTRCIVGARHRDDSTLLLVAGTVLLVLANATKYATAVFDPTVVALAAITIVRRRGLKPALARGGYVAAGTLGLISAFLALGGPWYLAGVLSTTLSRAVGNKSAFLVLTDAWKWSGLVCLIGGLGVVCALRRHDRVQVMLLTVLAASGALVPLDQARIHTTTSLFKQVDFGVWFAAAAAGFALAHVSGLGRRMWFRVVAASFAGILAVAFAAIVGRTQASGFFQEWPNSAEATAVIRSLTRSHSGNYLAEDYNIPAYYLENSIPWQRWAKTWYFNYTNPKTHSALSGAAAYQAAIDHGYFSLIILNFTDTVGTDSRIIADIHRVRTYQLVAVVPTRDVLGSGQVMVWEYEPPVALQEDNHGSH